jgi:SAM-dependent methyltransferase
MSMDALYDTIGRSYADTRRPDLRIAAAIEHALEGTSAVVNVGAGAGSYEPPQTRWAVEPSQTMIDQRRPGAAPAIQSTAERIPLADGEADAALAVLTIHHWSDLGAGIAEMRRVAGGRVVILTWDPLVGTSHWLSRDYLPELAAWDATRFLPIEDVAALMGGAEATVVPVPHDCTDGFLGAFWRRPAAYLDPAVRAGISFFAHPDAPSFDAGLTRLRADLESGEWARRNAELLELDELDVGYRLLSAGGPS